MNITGTTTVQQLKKCANCKITKPASEFSKQTKNYDGLKGSCKVCRKERDAASRKLKDINRQKRNGKLDRTSTDIVSRYMLLFWDNKRYYDVLKTLPIAQYAELLKQTCFYCDGPLNKTGKGLDRVDSKKGYETDNVVACCWGCNKIKFDHSIEELSAKLPRFLEAVNKLKGLNK